MRKSLKYRIYPSREQVDTLTYQLREACDLYNCAIEERKGAWKICRKAIGYYDQCYQLKPMRAEGLIGIPDFQCARDVLQRVDRTFKAFFRRVQAGKKPGYPRYKSPKRYNTLTFPQCGKGWKLIDQKVSFHGIGAIKIKIHRPIEGKVKTVTITRKAGRWFVIFCVECNPVTLPISNKTIGIDVGLSAFVTLSDGAEIDNPRFYAREEKRLRVAQRRLCRRKNKKSNRRRKAVVILQRIYVHITNQRSDFHHKIARMLVNRYGLIAVEDLDIKKLAKMMLAKSVHDAGWGEFLRKLTYKAESAGRELVRVDPNGTSQTCLCGAKVPKKLWNRWHSCTACGLEGARDHISAQLILRLGLSLRNVTWPEVRASVLREAVAV